VTSQVPGRVQLKCDGKRWRTGGEVKGKLANGVGNQYSSHCLGTWCIQHYYRLRELKGKLANRVGSQYSSHYLGTWCIQHYYRWRELKGKLANKVGSQYSSHYLGTWCIQHYYRWCAHLGCQLSTELMPPRRFKWTRPFRRKTKSGFCACAITFQTRYNSGENPT